MSEKILVIDDERDIANLLEVYLQNENYIVYKYYCAKDAMPCIENEDIDLAILDVMLPDMDGFSLCQLIREKYTYPIIMLTAKIEETDKITGLTLGADDYVTKPFHTKELLARIAVHLRIFDTLDKSEILTFEEIELDVDTHIVRIKDTEIKLTRTEYAILKLLMQNPSQVVSKSQLLDRISEDTPDCTESSLKTHISNLRKKLREVSGKEYVEAVWGIGFKMKTE